MSQNYPCATMDGWKYHVRRNDAPCRICIDWKKKHDAGEASKPAPIKAPTPTKVRRAPKARAECGSAAAFHGHIDRDEEVDPACREAINAYNREQYAKRQAKITKIVKPVREVQPCGTLAAARRHRYHGEPIDEDCRLAVCADNAERYQRVKARKKAEAAQ